ncbi:MULTISPECIES: hypothetical protein [Methylobacterium]|uniref:hypothetical protein n=1 Tax=Methylobacterium TaxID=407 RepID=UPI000B151EB1|nr:MULTISPECIES: hypothetical protein [Methylobacterium]MCI9878679.1 hypothetical protein [Methylobacterium goesingense]
MPIPLAPVSTGQGRHHTHADAPSVAPACAAKIEGGARASLSLRLGRESALPFSTDFLGPDNRALT